MLPQEERLFQFLQEDPVLTTSVHTSASEARSSSAGSSHVDGSSSGHADSRMRGRNGTVGSSTAHAESSSVSDSDSESYATAVSNSDTVGFSETAGWATSTNEGFGTAETSGESQAETVGTDRSRTRTDSVTYSEQGTDGYSDTVGTTATRGTAITTGDSVTVGESTTMTPFYEYVREEIETPVFFTPEEQRLIEMQKLANPKERHAVLLTPKGADYTICIPHVPTPMISQRRRAVRLKAVHSRESFYTPLITHEQGTAGNQRAALGAHRHAGGGDDDVIDVHAEDVSTPTPDAAVPSPTVDVEVEESLWKRWLSGARRQEKK
jgi:hypothetical protein